jgi:phosphate uptake regulator
MGDYAKNIGQIALDLHNECPFTPNEIEIVDRLVEMNNFALDQLKKAREAFKNNDIGAVAPIVKQDIEINRMFDEAHLLILKLPFSGKQLTNRALLLSRVAHNLERLGDRIVFFTKRIVFIEKGELVNY